MKATTTMIAPKPIRSRLWRVSRPAPGVWPRREGDSRRSEDRDDHRDDVDDQGDLRSSRRWRRATRWSRPHVPVRDSVDQRAPIERIARRASRNATMTPIERSSMPKPVGGEPQCEHHQEHREDDQEDDDEVEHPHDHYAASSDRPA